MNRFDFVKYDLESEKLAFDFKNEFLFLEDLASKSFKDGRSKAMFLTSLEEAYMWAGKSIRDEQMERNKNIELQEERINA